MLLRDKLAKEIWRRHFSGSTDFAFPTWEQLHNTHENYELDPERSPVSPQTITGALEYAYGTADSMLGIMAREAEKGYDA